MHGGRRTGAGRKKSAPLSKVVRIPETMIENVRAFVERGAHMGLPLYACGVSAGFPSPADDFMEGRLDLHEHLVKNPAATFFARATGNSMINAGIHDGDMLVVDRSISPKHGKIVVAAVNGDLTVKRYINQNGKQYLAPENPEFSPILIGEGEEVHVWGVVTNVIHKV